MAKRILTALCALCFLMTGCAGTAAVPEALTDGVTPSDQTGEASRPDCAPLTRFAAALLSEAAASGDENPVVSPVSAYLCLALAAQGAAGETLSEFEAILGADKDALGTLARTLTAALTAVAGNTQLSVANAVWADQDGVTLSPAFLQAAVDNFFAQAFSVDLPSAAARKAVNAWVAERTNGLIPTLREENYPAETALVLLNALYFKAKWRTTFDQNATYDEPFAAADGKSYDVPFLHMSQTDLPYVKTAGAAGVLLPYDDEKTAFLALLPDAGTDARAFAAQLSAHQFAACLDGAADAYMNLSLPRFTASYTFPMNDALKRMGLVRVFNPAAADLSAMGVSKDGNLSADSVLQKVKIIVDEEGTEAAAVTEFATCGTALRPEPEINLVFNRPFVYAVVDRSTGVPLFAGVMENPAAK